MNDNELQHHGILGMKWGIRRYQPYTGGKKGTFLDKKKKQYATAAEKNKAYQEKKRSAKKAVVNTAKKGATAYKDGMVKKHTRKIEDTKKQIDFVKSKKAKKEKPNPTKSMSDAELRQRINRLQMEKQYAQLTGKDKTLGIKVVNLVLGKIGNKVADRVIDRTIIDPIDDFFKGRG